MVKNNDYNQQCNNHNSEGNTSHSSPEKFEGNNHCCCVSHDKYYYGDLFHGQVTSPQSRSGFAVQRGWMAPWEANEMEGGKNFPMNVGGAFDPPWAGGRFLSDAQSHVPPPDGQIISGGRTGARDIVNYTDEELMRERGVIWPRIPVTSGQVFNVQWVYTQLHRTRGYSWWITTPTWDSSQRISRYSLGTNPFYNDYHTLQPFWNFDIAQMAPTVDHRVQLPNRTGHHVLLLAWIVADTGMAFYQAFDLNFA